MVNNSKPLCLQDGAILFDMDGTLIDSLNVATRTLELTLDHFGILPPEGIPLSGLFTRSEQGVLLAAGMPEELLEEAKAVWAKNTRDHRNDLAFYPGMPELMRKIKDHGCALGIVTGRTRDNFLSAEVTLQTSKKVDFIVLEGDIPESKPHPRPILYALEKLGVAPEKAVYIGDSPNDIEAAVRAGCTAILVTWGVSSGVADFRYQPDAIVSTIQELDELLFGSMKDPHS